MLVDNLQWLQASLPVKSGGLGLRNYMSLALPAFLASVSSTAKLQDKLLRNCPELPNTDFDNIVQFWMTSFQPSPSSSGPAADKQSSWDKPFVESSFASLLASQPDDYNRARLLAASAPHSVDWLHVLPIASCGLRLGNNAIRVAVGLRLGANLCDPHDCTCGAFVDCRGSHGMSCKRGSAKLARHAIINDIVHRSLLKAGVPSTKEPAGLSRTDGKRPDGLTLVPWSSGKSVVWDVTIVNTLAISYTKSTSANAGGAAEIASSRKEAKYAELSNKYDFIAIALETLGPVGTKTTAFLQDLGR